MIEYLRCIDNSGDYYDNHLINFSAENVLFKDNVMPKLPKNAFAQLEDKAE